MGPRRVMGEVRRIEAETDPLAIRMIVSGVGARIGGLRRPVERPVRPERGADDVHAAAMPVVEPDDGVAEKGDAEIRGEGSAPAQGLALGPPVPELASAGNKYHGPRAMASVEGHGRATGAMPQGKC